MIVGFFITVERTAIGQMFLAHSKPVYMSIFLWSLLTIMHSSTM